VVGAFGHLTLLGSLLDTHERECRGLRVRESLSQKSVGYITTCDDRCPCTENDHAPW
jgi:hypothetical protein